MADTPRVTVPVEPEYTAIDYLRLIAEGWEVIESTGSQVTIQNPEDDGPQELVIDVDLLSAAPAPEGGVVSRDQVLAIVRQFASPSWCSVDRLVDTLCAALATREEAPAEAGERERLIQDLSDAESWRRLPGNENHLATADLFARAISALRAQPPAREDAQPVAYRMRCQSDQPHKGGWWSLVGKHDGDHAIATGGGKNLQPLYTHPAPDALRVAVEALMLFRAFVQRNVTQWKFGAGDHHHPMWGLVAEALGDENRTEVTSGAEWRFIQPENRQALADLQAEQGAK